VKGREALSQYPLTHCNFSTHVVFWIEREAGYWEAWEGHGGKGCCIGGCGGAVKRDWWRLVLTDGNEAVFVHTH